MGVALLSLPAFRGTAAGASLHAASLPRTPPTLTTKRWFFHQSLSEPSVQTPENQSGWGRGASGSWRAPSNARRSRSRSLIRAQGQRNGLMCRQNKVCIATHFPPAWGGRRRSVGIWGEPVPTALCSRGGSCPAGINDQLLQSSPSHRTAQSPSTTSDGDENSNSGAAFGAERLPRFPPVLRWSP